jgi:T-complex protein 1 subunit alpha
MSIFQRDPRAGAFLGGDRVSGQDIRDQNGAFNIAIRREMSLKRKFSGRGTDCSKYRKKLPWSAGPR